MLKTTIHAAAALSFVALGAPAAYAGKGGGDGYGGDRGWHHGGGDGHHGGSRGGRHGGGGHHGFYDKWNKRNYWWDYSWYPSCHYEPRKVRVKLWDRRGRPYFKWVWRDVKVC